MSFEDKANEIKKRTNLLTNITIDWQYAQQIFPQIFVEQNKEASEVKKVLCNNFRKFCSNIEEDIKQLKSMIPNFDDKEVDPLVATMD